MMWSADGMDHWLNAPEAFQSGVHIIFLLNIFEMLYIEGILTINW